MSAMYDFIVNKISGNGRGLRVWKQLEKLLRLKQIDYRVHFTQWPEHAGEIARNLAMKKESSVIITVGGDGTIHDVANGLAGTNITLGCIPAGSGNDFARGLNISNNSHKALEQMLSSKRRKIDVTIIDNKSCITVVGIGFDGQVAKTTNNAIHKKWLNIIGLGPLSYVMSVFQVLLTYQPSNVQLKVDEQLLSFTNVWLIAVANFPFYGGGMKICPDALYDDGLLDICIVHNVSKWKFLMMLPGVYKGKHIHNSCITMLKGENIEVVADNPLIIHGDGEILGKTPTSITVERNQLSVIL